MNFDQNFDGTCVGNMASKILSIIGRPFFASKYCFFDRVWGSLDDTKTWVQGFKYISFACRRYNVHYILLRISNSKENETKILFKLKEFLNHLE